MRRKIIAALITFIFGFAIGFVFHGVWINREIRERMENQPYFPENLTDYGAVGPGRPVVSEISEEDRQAGEVSEPWETDRQEETGAEGFGLFSWNDWVPKEEEFDTLTQCMDQTHVTEIYQDFTEENYRLGETEEFVARLRERNVSVYALLGDAQWSYEENAGTLIKEMETAVRYNKQQPEEKQIKGFMIDVEPYILDEWNAGENFRQSLMLEYLKCMEIAYTYARKNQMEFLVCIPAFYDDAYPEVLERLVSDGCDGIAVMNYDRTDEYGQITAETELARSHDRRIICIYELQDVGLHGLKEIHTYANVGLDALWQSAEELKNRLDYDKLMFAYHYYLPLKNMLNK